jgi:SAM-dependent methyltransferase
VSALFRWTTRVRRRVLPGLRYLGQSELRRCRCCQSRTVFVSLSAGDEFRVCIRCQAGRRYEMLAAHIRRSYPDIQDMSVIELDPDSPLRPLLSRARCYVRTYYSPNDQRGMLGVAGARCEDITSLTFPDNSFDLIVSSEVLEHVPDLDAAFRESARVLRPGGAHVFTVPPRRTTRRRARVLNGHVVHDVEPEYHSDPLDPKGILAYWDIGIEDAGEIFSRPGLRLALAAGPEGLDGRVLWEARAAGDRMPCSLERHPVAADPMTVR